MIKKTSVSSVVKISQEDAKAQSCFVKLRHDLNLICQILRLSRVFNNYSDNDENQNRLLNDTAPKMALSSCPSNSFDRRTNVYDRRV